MATPTTSSEPKIPPPSGLQDDFGQLLQSGNLADVTLVVGEKDFHVHKAILASRSPVFCAMFQHDMKERRENRVVIEDLAPEVVEEMLRFVYTNSVTSLPILTEGLLQAGVKYDIQGLRSLCEVDLSRNISIQKAVDMLRLAHRHSLTYLKQCAVRFIEAHATEVMCKEEWKKALQER